MQKFLLKDIFTILQKTFKELGSNDPLRMAAATSFFTSFALPPILVIIIQTLSLVFNRRNISRQLLQRLESVVGTQSVDQIIETLKGFRELAENWYIAIGGFVFLVFVATTLFKIIKSSINQIWKVRVEERRSFKFRLTARLYSLVAILLAGILFLASLLADGAQALLGNYLNEISPVMAGYLNSALNYVASIVIVTIWFAVLFRYLPDGRPVWRIAITGAFVTSLLFQVGRIFLRWLLSYSNIDTLYGASGSLVLLLLFVFYSSMILYFGAAFTKVYADYRNKSIAPLPHAVRYHMVKLDIE